MSPHDPATVGEEVTTAALVAGGRAKAHLADGRVALVSGGAPRETVMVEIVKEHKRHVEAVVTEVIQASPQRQDPPCTGVALGCGGCDWQHLDHGGQLEAKRNIVIDALERLAGVELPPVENTVALHPLHYRTTVRALIDRDQPAYRGRGSHLPIVPTECIVAHPLVEELLISTRFPHARQIVIRISEATGQRLIIVDGEVTDSAVPDDVVVVTRQELAAGRRAWITEDVAGRSWRVSADAFFQPGPAGAEALVEIVLAQFAALDKGGVATQRVLDGYCGVGLFGGSIDSDLLVAVESSAAAAADARVNLATHKSGKIWRGDLARWRPVPVDVAVVDPPRVGMAKEALRKVLAAKPEAVIMVSCDAPTMARDTKRLGVAGFELCSVTPVDQFGQTSHVETVSRFVRR